jgi:hypothetical protein
MQRVSSFALTAAVAALVAPATGFAGSQTYILDNPEDYANPPGEAKPVGDPGPQSTGNGSWVNTDANQHLIYVQGGTDTDRTDGLTNDQSGANPQLLFDSSSANDPAERQVEIGEIQSMSWDVLRDSSSAADSHWFVNVFTRKGDSDSDTWYGHNLTFNLQDESNFTDDTWHTLEANRATDVTGPNEVDVYTDANLSNTEQQKTFGNWADDIRKPEWWDEEIWFLSLTTNSETNDQFTENLDNFNFEFQTGDMSTSEQVTVNFEAASNAVPTPSAVSGGVLLMSVLGGGAVLRRRKTHRA